MATLYGAFTSLTADFDTSGSWKDATSGSNATPANGDTLILDHRATGTLTLNLGKSALTPANLIIDQSFSGGVGVAATVGTTGTYLQIGAALCSIGADTGEGSPTGSTNLMLDFGSTTVTVTVHDSAGGSSDTYAPPIRLKGSVITLIHKGGNVGMAVKQGETATLVAGTVTSAGEGTTTNLYLGAGVTATALNANGGTIFSRSSNTTVTTMLSGSAIYTYIGTGAHTTLDAHGTATCAYLGSGTITALDVSGTFTRAASGATCTITNTTLRKGAIFDIDNGSSASTVLTNDPTLADCSMQDVTLRAPIAKWL